MYVRWGASRPAVAAVGAVVRGGAVRKLIATHPDIRRGRLSNRFDVTFAAVPPCARSRATCRWRLAGWSHVRSIRLLPGGPGPGRRVRHRDDRRRRAPAGSVVERRTDGRRADGRRAGRQGDRRDHAPAARRAVGARPVLGQGHLGRQPDDQRARRVDRGQAGLRAPVRGAPRPAARRRVLRVEEAGAGRHEQAQAAVLPAPGRRRRRGARRAVRVLEGPDASPTTTPSAGSSARPSSRAPPPRSSRTSTTGSR